MISLDSLTWVVRATVLRIVDGDTFSARLDLGWGIVRDEIKGAPSRIRLLGYYAPELRSVGGPEAKATLEKLLSVGSTVWLASHALDSFGRALCTVYLAGDVDLLSLLPQEFRRFQPLYKDEPLYRTEDDGA